LHLLTYASPGGRVGAAPYKSANLPSTELLSTSYY